jgi:hypothetical protein
MYKVYNKAFDDLFALGKKRLTELSREELKSYALKKGVHAIAKIDKHGRHMGIDVNATITAVESALTFSHYMGSAYWTTEQHERANAEDLLASFEAVKTGDQHFELAYRFGIGIHRLRPGESQEVEWTQEFIEDFIKMSPLLVYLVIYDEEGMVVAGTSDTKEPVEDLSTPAYDSMSVEDLRNVARKRGMKGSTFAKKDTILNFLKKDGVKDNG